MSVSTVVATKYTPCLICQSSFEPQKYGVIAKSVSSPCFLIRAPLARQRAVLLIALCVWQRARFTHQGPKMHSQLWCNVEAVVITNIMLP